MKSVFSGFVFASVMLSAYSVSASPITLQAALSGANEVPSNNSPAIGFATVILDPVAQTLQVNATFSGLTANDIAAHIHCCAPLGTNAGVATTVPAFPGFPLGVMSGTYISPVFDLTQPLIYNPAFVTLEGGLLQAEAAFISGLENGQTYFNIHTGNFPGGEIRGQLVPEPASFALFGSALFAFGLIRRRKKH